MKLCLYGKRFIHFQNNLILVFDSTEQICPVGIDSVKWDLNKPFLEEQPYVIGLFTNNNPK